MSCPFPRILKDLTKHDGSMGSIRETTYEYYDVTPDWH
jgi:hypothetical protein